MTLNCLKHILATFFFCVCVKNFRFYPPPVMWNFSHFFFFLNTSLTWWSWIISKFRINGLVCFLFEFLSTSQLIHPNLSSELLSFLTQRSQDSGSGFPDRSAILCARGGVGHDIKDTFWGNPMSMKRNCAKCPSTVRSVACWFSGWNQIFTLT